MSSVPRASSGVDSPRLSPRKRLPSPREVNPAHQKGVPPVRIASSGEINFVQDLDLYSSLPGGLAFIGRRSSNEQSKDMFLSAMSHSSNQDHAAYMSSDHPVHPGLLSSHYLSPHLDTSSLSPAESHSTSDSSSPLAPLQPLPPSSVDPRNNQRQASSHGSTSLHLVDPMSMMASPQTTLHTSDHNQVYTLPYGSIQLATEAQQRLFSGGSGALGLNELGEQECDEDIHGLDSDDDEDDDEAPTATTASAAKVKGKVSSSPQGKGKAGMAKAKAAVKGKQDSKTGRRKINISFIEDDARRHITFSKRKAGIMKKAYELATLTGTQVLLLVVSSTGLVYTFSTPKLKPVVRDREGRELIQTCLNAPDPIPGDEATSSSAPSTSTDASSVPMRSASSYRSSSQPTRADLMQSCRTPTIDSRIKSPRIRASSPNRPNKRRRTASSLNESTTMCASGDVQENDNQATGSDNGAVGRLIGRQRDDAAAAVAMANHSHASHTRRASLQPMSLQQNVTNAFAHPAAKQFNLMQGVQRTQHDTHIRSVSALNPSEDPRMHGNHAISGLPQPTFISADDEQQLANAIPWISGLSTKLLYDTPKGQNASFWGTGPMLGSMTDGSDPGAQHWGR